MVVLNNTQHAKEEYQYGKMRDKLAKVPSKILRLIGFTITERNQLIKLSRKNNAYTRPVSLIDLTDNKWIEWADIIHLHWVNNYLDYPSFFTIVR